MVIVRDVYFVISAVFTWKILNHINLKELIRGITLINIKHLWLIVLSIEVARKVY